MGDDYEGFDGLEPEEDRLFDLEEAEELLPQLTVWLTEAMEQRVRVQTIEKEFARMQNQILMRGGMLPPHAHLAEKRVERERYLKVLREALEKITEAGCLVKDLDTGLIDFPAMVEDEQALLCWKLGEERIRYWHRADEGFAGRKRLDSSDPAEPEGSRPN